MNIIAAPTANKAALYAAGLNLRDDQWTPLARATEGIIGDFHVLPGASHSLQLVYRLASPSARLFDLTEVT